MKKLYVTKIRRDGERIVEVKVRRTLLSLEEEMNVSLNWIMLQLTNPDVVIKTAILKDRVYAEGAELVLVESSSGTISIRTRSNQTVQDNLERLPSF